MPVPPTSRRGNRSLLFGLPSSVSVQGGAAAVRSWLGLPLRVVGKQETSCVNGPRISSAHAKGARAQMAARGLTKKRAGKAFLPGPQDERVDLTPVADLSEFPLAAQQQQPQPARRHQGQRSWFGNGGTD